MAGGANRKFLDQRDEFLRSNVIQVDVADSQLVYVANLNADPSKAVLARVGRLNGGGAAAETPVDRKAAGVFDFDLVKLPTTADVIVDRRTMQMPVYSLVAWGTKDRDQRILGDGRTQVKKPSGAHPIRAFWLPWSANSTWSAQLGPQADYFFTATMDGCSLAVSSGNTPVVTHGNYRTPQNPGVACEAMTQTMIRRQHADLGVDVRHSLPKDRYAATPAEKNNGINKLVTVVGFRDPRANSWKFYWQRRQLRAVVQGPPTRMILTDRLVPIV